MDHLQPPFSDLTPEERGFVAGAALVETAAGFERLSAPTKEHCENAWRALRSLGRADRARALAALIADARAPVPEGIDLVHPSWIRETLADEPSDLVAAIAEGLPANVTEAACALLRERGEDPGSVVARALLAEALAEVRRFVLAPVAALLGPPSGPQGADLGKRSPAETLDEITRLGVRTIALSLVGAPREVRARAMAALGEPWAAEIATVATTDADKPERERARRLVAEASRSSSDTASERARAVGLLALAEALRAEGRGSCALVAGRLPSVLGRTLLS